MVYNIVNFYVWGWFLLIIYYGVKCIMNLGDRLFYGMCIFLDEYIFNDILFFYKGKFIVMFIKVFFKLKCLLWILIILIVYIGGICICLIDVWVVIGVMFVSSDIGYFFYRYF